MLEIFLRRGTTFCSIYCGDVPYILDLCFAVMFIVCLHLDKSIWRWI